MTIPAKKKESTKRLEPIPSLIAMDVAIEQTSAAWLEGIPPVRQAMVSSNSRLLLLFDLSSAIIALTSWARNQLVTADKNIGFSTKALTCSARVVIEKDINLTIPQEGKFVNTSDLFSTN
jgi:SpoU rRNA methylase family enzyme